MDPRRAWPLVAAVVAGALVVAVLSRTAGDDDPPRPLAGTPTATAPVTATPTTQTPAPLTSPPTTPALPSRVPGEAAAAKCRPVTDHPSPKQVKHLDGPIDYDRAPPNSGDHAGSVPRRVQRVFTVDDAPTVEEVVHSLEHGYVVVWYDPAVADDGKLAASLNAVPTWKMFAMPWTRGTLPTPIVVTAWGHEQRCTAVTARQLAGFFAEHGGPNGEAPEPHAS